MSKHKILTEDNFNGYKLNRILKNMNSDIITKNLCGNLAYILNLF